jgi:DNA-binding response OmpR family regulator
MPVKKIVIVDDDENIRKTFFLILNKQYRVYLAKDGQEVLDRFGKAGIDLMIADYKLPGMNGVDLAVEMRKNGYKGDIIMISAHPDMIEPDLLTRLAISYFFAKPLDLTAMSRAIDYLLNLRGQQEKRI